MAEKTNNNFKYISNMLRAWKNKQGFKLGGLLIDTLIYNFINNNENYKVVGFDRYLSMTKDLFSYLKNLNEDQIYWYALGSNQKVYNSENGKFIKKAEKAYNKIKDLTKESDDLNVKLREIFGNQFPESETQKLNKRFNKYFMEYDYSNTEQFIENKFPIDINYNLILECRVTQDGFRPNLLSSIIKNKQWLSKNKKLEFFMKNSNVKGDYDIYWKVKNQGDIAKKRNCIRGQIVKTNKQIQLEHTDFKGEHYVECYIVQNRVCVAKNRIEVPIATN